MKKKGTGRQTGTARRAKPEVTPNLRARLAIMRQIGAIVKKKDWIQAEAAERCGVSQPRINDLLRGRLERFSLDALVNIAAALGRKVKLTVE